MKITFNPIVKNKRTHVKPLKINTLQQQNKINLNGLDCISNYNLSFQKRAIYAINYDGSYEKFDTIKQAAKGKSVTGILHVLAGRMNCADGKVYVYADEMEDRSGGINLKAINKAILNFKDADNQPIYSIDFHGNTQRYENSSVASRALGINRVNITQVLLDYQRVTLGYTFIKAFDVELRDEAGKILKDENSKPILDAEAINKAREKFLNRGNNFPVVSIDCDGNIKLYESINEAALDLNCDRKNINQSINNLAITQKKYVFARLSDVVLIDELGDVVFDENNDFMIDNDKVDEIKKLVFEK